MMEHHKKMSFQVIFDRSSGNWVINCFAIARSFMPCFIKAISSIPITSKNIMARSILYIRRPFFTFLNSKISRSSFDDYYGLSQLKQERSFSGVQLEILYNAFTNIHFGRVKFFISIVKKVFERCLKELLEKA